MRPLTAAELLQAWESAIDQPAIQRGLTLLGPACPELSGQALAALPLGRRDGLLLTLREWTFGPRLTALTDCPGCGARVELEFNSAEIRTSLPPELPEFFTLEVDDVRIQFRLPDSRDLTALAAAGEAATARGRAILLQRCIRSIERQGRALTAAELPGSLEQALVAEMARLDSQADVRLSLTCPACGRRWSEAFDIAAYFWEELQRWALRLLAEVHSLAVSYGWREADILAMSPRRRQLYLQMINP